MNFAQLLSRFKGVPSATTLPVLTPLVRMVRETELRFRLRMTMSYAPSVWVTKNWRTMPDVPGHRVWSRLMTQLPAWPVGNSLSLLQDVKAWAGRERVWGHK